MSMQRSLHSDRRWRPHIPKMRENVAKALGVDVSQVNIKATTEEGLGFTGTGEGIQCTGGLPDHRSFQLSITLIRCVKFPIRLRRMSGVSEGGTRMRLYYDDQKELGPVFCDLWRTILKIRKLMKCFIFRRSIRKIVFWPWRKTIKLRDDPFEPI